MQLVTESNGPAIAVARMRHLLAIALVSLVVVTLGMNRCSSTATAVAPESTTDLRVAVTLGDTGWPVPAAEALLDAGIRQSLALQRTEPCSSTATAVGPESTTDLRVAVTVRDDTGCAVPAAEVLLDPGIAEYPALYRSKDPQLVMFRDHPGRGSVVARTDASGHATIVAARGQPLAVRARCRDHIPAMATFFDSVPAAIDLVVPRGGRIAGHIDDPGGLANHAMWIAAWPQGGDPQRDQRSIPLAADGAFHSSDLLPGPWFVAVYHCDASKWRQRPPQVLPLLGSAIDERTRTLLVVPPAGTVEVTMHSRPLARIDGRVLVNGVPAGDIVVFAVSQSPTEPDWDDEGFNPARLDAPDAHHTKPHTRTAADGSFTMHVATTGTYELRARHPRQPVASPPTLVEVTTLSDRLTVEVQLPAGVLRGCYRQVHAGPRALSAQLYPVTAATGDPFYHGDLSESQAMDRLRIELDGQGAFQFEFVPPGDYVLRLLREPLFLHSEIVWQGAVTVGSGMLDLGELIPATKVTGSAIVSSPDECLGAWIRQTLPGVPEAFVRTVWVTGGRLWLVGLPPGRYRVQFFTPGFHVGQCGLSGTPRGGPIEIELRGDGSTEPRVVSLP